jgi:hypothetical protein
MLLPVLPFDQLIVPLQPVAFSVVLLPEQIVLLVALMVGAAGRGVT